MLLCYHLSLVWESAIHKRCRNVTMLSPVTGVGKCVIHQRCRNVTMLLPVTGVGKCYPQKV